MSGSDANHDTPTSSPELGLPVGASRSSPDEALANLRAVVHGNALEARDGMYFNGELPLEVFVTIIAHCVSFELQGVCFGLALTRIFDIASRRVIASTAVDSRRRLDPASLQFGKSLFGLAQSDQRNSFPLDHARALLRRH